MLPGVEADFVAAGLEGVDLRGVEGEVPCFDKVGAWDGVFG